MLYKLAEHGILVGIHPELVSATRGRGGIAGFREKARPFLAHNDKLGVDWSNIANAWVFDSAS